MEETYEVLLEQTGNEWEDGYGVIQIVRPGGADENRRSLREWADYFNQQLLKAALDEANVKHLEGESRTHIDC